MFLSLNHNRNESQQVITTGIMQKWTIFLSLYHKNKTEDNL